MTLGRAGHHVSNNNRHKLRTAIIIIAVFVVLGYGWVSLVLYRKMFTANSNTQTTTGEYARTESMYPIEKAERPSLGDSTADLVIVEFTGYQCELCQAQSELIRRVVSIYNGSIRYILRDYPPEADDWSVRLAEAAACADDQGKFWIMHDRMAVRPQIVDQTLLESIAKSAGLDMDLFKSCFDGREHQDQVRQDITDGKTYGVAAVPTIFVNGHLIKETVTEDELYKIIDSVYPDLKSLHKDLDQPEVVDETTST